MVQKNAHEPETMKQWLDEVESLMDSRLDELSKTLKLYNVNEALKDKTVLT